MKYIKGQMNQKIEIFSFVALPSQNTKKKHLYRHRNDPHHRNDLRHRNDPQSPPK